MLAEAARTLATRYGVKPGARVVVATAHDSAYRAALDLAEAGCEIAMIADLRAEATAPLAAGGARAPGCGSRPTRRSSARDGALRVTHALVAKLLVRRRAGQAEAIACDCVAMSGGWTPNVHLFSQSRGKLAFDEATQTFPARRAGVEAAARPAPAAASSISPTALADGVARRRGGGGRERRRSRRASRARRSARAARWRSSRRCGESALGQGLRRFPERRHRARHRLATREGMRSIEHIKRYTTAGMATDQGKTTN